MAKLRHPLNGALYSLEEDGLVKVENNGLTGRFSWDGQHREGELTYADPHMLVWLAGPQLPRGASSARKHRG